MTIVLFLYGKASTLGRELRFVDQQLKAEVGATAHGRVAGYVALRR
ncbi:hypothetical protein [Rhodococcus sp. IEGM 1318]|nr:hypothetical protein [Rhodococcus sp. IEGM 1318]MDV8005542.1 hypothetical protein [Rhodococcus sp. IEGM 1318]